MLKPTDATAAILASARILEALPQEALARLAAHAQPCKLGAGETFIHAQEPAARLYLLPDGAVTLCSGAQKHALPSPTLVGEEAALGAGHYLFNATATATCHGVSLPADILRAVLREHPQIRNALFLELHQHFSSGRTLAQHSEAAPPDEMRGASAQVIGWLLALLAPIAILLLAPHAGLKPEATLFAAIMAATICTWAFRLAPEFVAALFAALALIVLGLAPAPLVLGGFSSDIFFMALSIFALGGLVADSGLHYRLLLWALRILPPHQGCLHASLLAIGILHTPLMPSASARAALMMPLLQDLLAAGSAQPGRKLANHLGVATLSGISLSGAHFLTGKSANFVIFGLLSLQLQAQFSWAYWLTAGALVFAFSLAGHALLALLMFRNDEPVTIARDMLKLQLRALGPITRQEMAAALGIALFTIGVFTAPLHKIAPAWLALGLLYLLMLLTFFTQADFRTRINWSQLLYIGTAVGLVSAMHTLGVDQLIARQIDWLGALMQSNLSLAILLIAGLLFVLRLGFSANIAILIGAALLMPLAHNHGVNAWLIGFIVVLLGETWFLPFQCADYQRFCAQAGTSGLFEEKRILLFNALFNLVRVAAICASIPFWKYLGIL